MEWNGIDNFYLDKLREHKNIDLLLLLLYYHEDASFSVVTYIYILIVIQSE